VNNSVLGLITARGNSKGIHKKNIKQLSGKPLIAWTIEEALKCKKIERVIVSTDSSEIAEISSIYGAEVPFMRPEELAKDFSDHIEVMIHAIEWIINRQNWTPDYVMLLQPTSPLREEKDILAAIEIAQQKNADSIISVTKADSHPYFARQVNEKGILVDFIETPQGYLPRQILPEVFNENGAIYLAKSKVLLEQKTWYTNLTFPYIMPAERSIDVNTPWDLKLAELIMNNRTSN
jgi:N-acylneuraminate cytidylyltransferase/CMP-N,N'-diacetyllegionaminic acid synthase